MAAHALFLYPEFAFPKLASESVLPEDPNLWPNEIMQELYKQVPYLNDFEVDVQMERVDAERGYGFGQVNVHAQTEAPDDAPPEQMEAAGIRNARIPVIVQENKLQPFDVVLTDTGRVLPLTESRLRQAIFRPHMFDVTSKTPGDQSMIGQLYPPYRQNYGFGGGGVAVNSGMGGKTASALEQYIANEALFEENATLGPSVTKTAAAHSIPAVFEGSPLALALGTANESDVHAFKTAMADLDLREAYMLNAATYDAVEKIANADVLTVEKRASVIARTFPPSVTQIQRVHSNAYQVKTASHYAWAPELQTASRADVIAAYGSDVLRQVDLSGAVTMQHGASVKEASTGADCALVVQPGVYECCDSTGEECVGAVIPNLIDISGDPIPISLYTDGRRSAVQSEICARYVSPLKSLAGVAAREAQGVGVFYCQTEEGAAATIPLEVKGSYTGPAEEQEGATRIVVDTFDGRHAHVSIQPQIAKPLQVDGVLLIPEAWSWLSLDGQDSVDLCTTPDEMGARDLPAKMASVEVRASGDSFSVRGVPLAKLAADDHEFLDQGQALFLLGALGADLSYAQTKLAEAYAAQAPRVVRVGHHIKTAQELRGESYVRAAEYLEAQPVLRRRLWKEAAVIPDPAAVDAVLSLGFINPENAQAFIGYLPVLDEAQSRLCDLLLAARLGIRELPSGALERSIRSLEDVIEGLKIMAFQG